MTRARAPSTYEREALAVLAWEFPSSNKDDSERKIRGRLRRKKLGPYDPARIERLRRLKDALQAEIGRDSASRYFGGRHGHYSEMADFDAARMTADYAAEWPELAVEEMSGFIGYCLLNYYLR